MLNPHRRPRTHRPLLTIVAVAVSVFVGCETAQDERRAQVVTERYFSMAAHDDYAPIFDLYSTAFSEASPKWRQEYAQLRHKLGRPKSHVLKATRVRRADGSVAGDLAEFVYDVQYERTSGTEIFDVVLPADGKRAPQIQAHQFEPSTLPDPPAQRTTRG